MKAVKPFVLGTVAPISARRGPDVFGNNSVFFNFAPGFTGDMFSDVLVVSTNASSFTNIGDMGVDGSGTFSSSSSTVSSQLGFYSPSGTVVAAPVATPDSGTSALLLALALAGLFATRRSLRNLALA
ncbi:MAG: VPDSG-CTERM sorting domain-containing protein [Chthoniobacterales bacterium]